MQTCANKCQPPCPPMLMCCAQVGSNSSIWRAGLGCSEGGGRGAAILPAPACKQGCGQRCCGACARAVPTPAAATAAAWRTGVRVRGAPVSTHGIGLRGAALRSGQGSTLWSVVRAPTSKSLCSGRVRVRAAPGLMCVAQHHFSAKHDCSRVFLGAHVWEGCRLGRLSSAVHWPGRPLVVDYRQASSKLCVVTIDSLCRLLATNACKELVVSL